jgi:hypothetical protein
MMIKIKLTTFMFKPGLGSGWMLLDLWPENRHSCRLSNKKSLDFATSSVVIQTHNDQFYPGNAYAMTVKQQIRALSSQP